MPCLSQLRQDLSCRVPQQQSVNAGHDEIAAAFHVGSDGVGRDAEISQGDASSNGTAAGKAELILKGYTGKDRIKPRNIQYTGLIHFFET